MERVGAGASEKQLEDCTIEKASCSKGFLSLGLLVALPVCIKRNSVAPMFIYPAIGTMLDVITGIIKCEREHEERQMKLPEAQELSANATSGDESSESFGNLDK